ncbi:hypothetical protein ACFY2Z_24680 [Streptomyces sp. NPDC001222]
MHRGLGQQKEARIPSFDTPAAQVLYVLAVAFLLAVLVYGIATS